MIIREQYQQAYLQAEAVSKQGQTYAIANMKTSYGFVTYLFASSANKHTVSNFVRVKKLFLKFLELSMFSGLYTSCW